MTILAKPARSLNLVGATHGGITIKTRRLTLNALGQDDQMAVFHIFNDRQSAMMAHDIAWPLSPEAAEKKLASLLKDCQNVWAIRLFDGEMIGIIYLSEITCGQARSLNDFGPNLSLYIAPQYRGFGYGTEALEMILEHLKLHRGLKVIQAAHFSDNGASGHALSKAGLLYTGRRTFETSLARPSRAEVRHMIMFL